MTTPAEGHLPEAVLHTLRHLSERVMRVLQADASGWNGKVKRIAVTENVLGGASWAGDLHLREDLLRALERMHVQPGATWDQRSRDEFLNALKTAVHEFAHFAHPSSRGPYHHGAAEYRRWASRVLEEGATEAFTEEWIRLCARDLEAVAPGVSSANIHPSYQRFTPAVRELSSYAAALYGIKPRTVLSLLNKETARDKFERFAQLVLDANGLWGQIPNDQQLDCRDRVVQAIRDVFWRNSDWAKEWDKDGYLITGDASGRSKIMGMQAACAVERVRLEIEARYGTLSGNGSAWEMAAATFECDQAVAAIRFSRTRPAETRRAAQQWLDRATDLIQVAARASQVQSRAQSDRHGMQNRRFERVQVFRRSSPDRRSEQSPGFGSR